MKLLVINTWFECVLCVCARLLSNGLVMFQYRVCDNNAIADLQYIVHSSLYVVHIIIIKQQWICNIFDKTKLTIRKKHEQNDRKGSDKNLL